MTHGMGRQGKAWHGMAGHGRALQSKYSTAQVYQMWHDERRSVGQAMTSHQRSIKKKSIGLYVYSLGL